MAKTKLTEYFSRVSIRSTIYLYFTISALTALILMGISFYGRLVGQMTAAIQEENQTMLAQVNHSVDSYLRTIMKLSDSLYYDVKNILYMRRRKVQIFRALQRIRKPVLRCHIQPGL